MTAKKREKAPTASVPDLKKLSSNASTAEPAQSPHFFRYLLRTNKKYLLATLITYLLLFILYKLCYPLPDFSADSQSYINAAILDYKSYYRPFGYSRFLQIIHGINSSHHTVVAVQYSLLAMAAAFSFFSVDYLYGFHNAKIKFLAWLLVTVNPCLPALANLILSDALFIAFSAIWFTLFLWIIKKKKWWCLLLQLFFLYAAFQIRYNALYYPLITGLVFLFTPGLKLPYRLTGMAASFFLVFSAYTTIKKENERTTGTAVFAGFAGWQTASNALLIYKKADIKTEDFDSPDLQNLDQCVKYFIDSLDAPAKMQIEKAEVPSAVFLWDGNSPLKRYTFYYATVHNMTFHAAWYQVSTLYNEYGWTIIKQHPGLYFRNYLLPNFYQYIAPPRELLRSYDDSKEALNIKTRNWLQIKDVSLRSNAPGLQEILLYPYSALHGLLLLFSLTIPILYLWKYRKQNGAWQADIIVPAMLWYIFLGADIVFSCFASPIVLRYIAILFIIGYGLPFYYLDQLFNRNTATQPVTP